MQSDSSRDVARPGSVKKATAQLIKRAGATIGVMCLLAINVLIASCGSSGSGSGDGTSVSSEVVTGVAATGAPLSGLVTLRDSSSVRKDKVTNVGTDGSFAIDVTDMRAPFILKATGIVDGVSRTLYSFADKSGTANINPFSGVALANAAGVDDPAEVFDNSDSATLEKIKTAMPASVASLQEKLMPLLNAFSAGKTNPIKDHFTADHSGLDGVFDNVKVSLSHGVLTITNATSGAVIFTAPVRYLEHGRITDNDDDLPKPGPRPAAPTGVKAVGGDAQVTISWDPVANATSYDLFYATKSRLTEEEDNDDVEAKRVRNVTSPYVLTELSANTTYFFVVRAISNHRRGPASAEISATTSATTPAPTIPAAPAGVTAAGGTKQATITWTAVAGATLYNLYWSPTTGVTTTNGTKISGVTSPAVHTGLTDGTAYYYIVTAMNSAGESAASLEVTATTLGVAPTTTTTTTTTAAPTTTTAAPTTTTTAAPTTTTTTAPPTTTTTTAAPTTTTTTAAPTTTTTTAAPTTTTTTAAPTTTTTTTAAPTTTTTTAAPTTTTTAAPTTTTTAAPTTTTTTAAPTTTTTTAAPTTTTTTSTTTTTTTTASTTTTTLAINGAALYTTYCAGCHGDLGASDQQGASAALITSAIANVSSMRTRFNATTGTLIKLTPEQIAAIAAALQ